MTPERHSISAFLADFAWAVDIFGRRFEIGNDNFTRGTALHFHARLIERVRKHGGFPSRWVSDDDEFVELLYAMSAAWGMDSAAARVKAYPAFRSSVHAIAHSHAFKEFETASVHDLDERWLDRLLALWKILLGDGKLMAGRSVTVAASKVLHHLLPDVFAPVDRRYTLDFLQHLDEAEPYRISTVEYANPGQESFVNSMLLYGHVARALPNISQYLDSGPMTASVPKIIDNAIIAWWGFRLG